MSSYELRRYIDILAESEQQQLDEGIMDSLKAGVQNIVGKISAIPAFAPYFKAAQAHQQELQKILQTTTDPEQVKAKIAALAQQTAPAVNEGHDVGIDVRGKIAASGLQAILSAASVLLAKGVGAYASLAQGAQQGFEAGHGVAGLIGIMMPLMAAFLAYQYYKDAQSDVRYNKQHYPGSNPITGNPRT